MIKKKYVILKKIFFNLYTRKTHLYKKKESQIVGTVDSAKAKSKAWSVEAAQAN
jgi:hypothetical protein